MGSLTAQQTDEPAVVRPRAAKQGPVRRGRSIPRRAQLPREQPLPKAAHWETRFVAALVLLDTVLICIAVAGGIFIRFDEPAEVSDANAAVAFVLVPLWLLMLASSRAYERQRLNIGTEQFKAVFEASVRMAALVAFLSYLTKSDISRGFFLLALPGGFLALILGRLAARTLLHRARRRGRCVHRVLAVGHAPDIEHLVTQLQGRDHHGLQVVAACTSLANGDETVAGIPVIGSPAEARSAAAQVCADTVAVTSAGVLGRKGLRRLAWQLEGSETGLLLTPELTDVAGPRINVRPVGALSLLQVSEPKFSSAGKLFKGAFDRIVAAIALLVLSPLLLAVAVWVKLDSRGPVLFRQVRSGMGGQPFKLVKFRSMVASAEDLLIDLTDRNEGSGALFKIRNDPRITRAGRILRRLSLDELPQLWNVVAGDMSLVGPRPPLPGEVEKYGCDVRRRLLVKPGLTGLWQVSGRSDLSWEESVRLDLYYVENWSFALDVMILARTVTAVVAGRGAY